MSREQRLKSERAAAKRVARDAFVANPCRLSAQQTEALLNELCITLGYCLTPSDYDAVVANPPTHPQAFAELVMRLDGVDPGEPGMLEPVLDQILATFEGIARAPD